MKRMTLIILMSTLFAVPTLVPAAERPVAAPPGITGDLNTMAGMLTDIGRLLGQKPITPAQRRQIMGLLGELGGVMQEMGAGGEIEGWRLSKERHQIHGIKVRLDKVRRQLE